VEWVVALDALGLAAMVVSAAATVEEVERSFCSLPQLPTLAL
jgi:hypothetical protein